MMKKETTTERILNDAEAVIRAARPVFRKHKGRRVVRVKVDGKMSYEGVAQTDAEEMQLLRNARDKHEGARKSLWPGQVVVLTELAKRLYPDLTRRYLKARDTVIRRARMDDIGVEELETIQEWNRKRLARMSDAERAECLKMRKRIVAARAKAT